MKTIWLLILSLLVIGLVQWLPQKSAEPDAVTEVWSEDDWVQYLQSHTADVAYQHFKERHAGENFTAHGAAHGFGRALYRVYGDAGLATCDEDFQGGCLHGYVGELLFVDGIERWPAIFEACEVAQPDNIVNCRHSVGHGFQLIAGYSEEGLQSALDSCFEAFYKSASSSQDLSKQCYHGVFMEFNQQNISHVDVFTHREFDAAEPYRPCDQLDTEFKDACYYRQARLWVIAQRNQDLSELYERLGGWCRNIPDSNHEARCNLGVMTTISSYAGVTDQAQAKQLCEIAFTAEAPRDDCFGFIR